MQDSVNNSDKKCHVEAGIEPGRRSVQLRPLPEIQLPAACYHVVLIYCTTITSKDTFLWAHQNRLVSKCYSIDSVFNI